jgi:putative flippase GtrA
VLIALVAVPILGFTGRIIKKGGAAAFPEQAAWMSYFSAAVERMERLGLPIPKGLHKFLGVGLVGLIVHTGVFTLLYKLDTDPFVRWLHTRLGDGGLFVWLRGQIVQHSWAWLVGLITATAITWTLNRKLTFAATGRKLHQEVFRYAVVTIISQTVAFLVFHGLVELAKPIPAPIDVIIGAVCATVISYAGQRFFTFAPHKEKASETIPQ